MREKNTFTGRMLFLTPNQQCQRPEGSQSTGNNRNQLARENLGHVMVLVNRWQKVTNQE